MICVLLALLLSLTIVAVGGCSPEDAPEPPASSETDAGGPLKGVSLSPRSCEPDDFLDFLERTRETGKIVTWAGDWNQLAPGGSGGPGILMELASQYGFTPVVLAQFFTQDTGELIRPLDTAGRSHYRDLAADFAAEYHPPYLILGIEVSVLYEKSPADFAEFVALYAETRAAIKKASPQTTVCTNFQLERMKGLHGGLFGGTNDPGQAEWFLIDEFEQDIASFTTYPFLVFKSPAEIPSDYYTETALHSSGPVAFTEIGWHSDADIPGWESSQEEQAEFVRTFFALTKEMDVEMAVWPFMFDQEVRDPFKHVGLIERDGNARLAWDAWMESGN